MHTVKTKGISNTVKRVVSLIKRYGLGQDGIKKNIAEYIDIIRKYDGKVTFPIPAMILDRNIEFIERINQDFVEWAMHGYIHINYAKESVGNFKRHLEKGKNIFKKNRINLYGFRAPYLSIKQNFLKEMSNTGLVYDSSFTYNTGLLDEIININKSAKKILDFYSPRDSNLKQYGKLVEIPVWLPDDEMIIDRLHLLDAKMEKYFMNALELSIQLKTPLILQLHPERFFIFKKPLENFIKVVSKKYGVDMLTLNEISEKYRNGSLDNENPVIAITGDVDIISIYDLMAMKKKIKLEGDQNV